MYLFGLAQMLERKIKKHTEKVTLLIIVLDKSKGTPHFQSRMNSQGSVIVIKYTKLMGYNYKFF